MWTILHSYIMYTERGQCDEHSTAYPRARQKPVLEIFVVDPCGLLPPEVQFDAANVPVIANPDTVKPSPESSQVWLQRLLQLLIHTY